MRMTNEQFIDEVFHRRDEALRRRRKRQKAFFTVAPVLSLLIVSVVYLNVSGRFNQKSEGIVGETDNANLENAAVYYNSADLPVVLSDDALQWLLDNALSGDEGDDGTAIGAGPTSDSEDYEISEDANKDDISSVILKGEKPGGLKGSESSYNSMSTEDTKHNPDGTVIEVRFSGEIHIFILNGKGLYSCEKEQYIPFSQEKLDVFRKFIE